MPSYKRPGVFVEERLSPLTNTLNTPSESTAAFVGTNPQGPTSPLLITSWAQYKNAFGDFGDGSHYLPFAVYSFFSNGGSRAFVVRAAPVDSVAAHVTLNNRDGSPVAILTLTATSPGPWANNLSATVVNNGIGTGRFDFIISVFGVTAERWIDVSLDPSDSRYLVPLLNAPVSGSAFVTARNLLSSAANYVWAVEDTPAVQANTPFTGGLAGAAGADLVSAVEKLDVIEGTLTLNLPGVADTDVLSPVITWAENKGSVFVILDAPEAVPGDSAASTAVVFAGMATGGSAVTSSSYAAIYGPWLLSADPASSVAGAMRVLPPGGAVLGQFARTDATRGPAKAPAGVGTVLSGVIDVQVTFSNADQDMLNQAGINLIKRVPGYGFVIWGARTLKSGFPDRYISVRRSLMYIKKALHDGTRFAVFEPHTAELRLTLRATIQQFLNGIMQDGMLAGSTPDTAYFVICDETNNPPASVAAGELHIEVGLALLSPAEFIVISLGQFQGSGISTATETL